MGFDEITQRERFAQRDRFKRIGQRMIFPQGVKNPQMGAIQGDRLLVVDSEGLVSTASFLSDSTTDSSVRGPYTNITLTDVDETATTFTLSRTTKVLVMVVVNDKFTDAGTGGWGHGWVYVITDDVADQDTFLTTGWYYETGEGGDSAPLTQTYTKVVSLSEGDHTIKLQAAAHPSGEPFYITQTTVTYLMLGN